ncbi:hypothetical protein ANANG_G00235500 [Anguilla anguilla]|uniref:Uncharacterized protein n=1 Tax=Anguilla anguilla TaxID=7936 RepID=A0A9D3LWJ8_ANGAN|nr:hypothetical protein ANANG_G00235500 [Anguilla anguilla]
MRARICPDGLGIEGECHQELPTAEGLYFANHTAPCPLHTQPRLQPDCAIRTEGALCLCFE